MRLELNGNAYQQHQRPEEKQSKGGHEYVHGPLQKHPHPNDGLRAPSKATAIRSTLDDRQTVSYYIGTYCFHYYGRALANNRDCGMGWLVQRPKRHPFCEWIGGSSID